MLVYQRTGVFEKNAKNHDFSEIEENIKDFDDKMKNFEEKVENFEEQFKNFEKTEENKNFEKEDEQILFIQTNESIKSRIKKENHEFLRDKLLFDQAYSIFLLEFIKGFSIPETKTAEKEFSLTSKIAEGILLYELFMNTSVYEKCTSTELFSIPEVLEIRISIEKSSEAFENLYKNELLLIKLGTLFAIEMLIRGKKTNTFIVFLKALKKIYKVHAPACIWLLKYLQSHKQIFFEILLENRDFEPRKKFKNLLCHVLKNSSKCEQAFLLEKAIYVNTKALPYDSEYFNKHNLYKQKWVSATSRFVKMILEDMMKKKLLGSDPNNEYFELMKFFKKLGKLNKKLLYELAGFSSQSQSYLGD